VNLIKAGNVWWAQASYEERAIPKAALMWWHGMGGACYRNCGACAAGLGKCWWTPKAEIASRLAKYAQDSATRAELEGAHAQREVSLAMSRASELAPTAFAQEIPAPPGLEYRPFQRAGIAYAMMRPSTLIADEMGLGKTIQAIGVINTDSSVKSVLVICPASLRLNWRNELAKWLVRPMTIKVIEERELPSPEDQVVVVNYDKLIGARGKELRTVLLSREWDVLIVDEAHYLKNQKAKRTQVVLGRGASRGEVAIPGLIQRARRRLFLTGTPILNRPIEIQPLVGAITPQEFGNFFMFAKRYANAHQTRFGWDFSGASNLEELQERLRATCLVRRLKRDVLKELPPKTRQVIVLAANGLEKIVEKESKAWSKYESAIAELKAKAELADASGNELAYRAAIEDLMSANRVAFEEISKVRHEVSVAKIPYVLEHLENMIDENPGKKVIVFAHHLDVLDAIYEAFKDRAVIIKGDTGMQERDDAVRRFQDPNSGVQMFVGSLKAAGVGLTLTAADKVVFAELDWVPANVSQAEDRAHRIGQEGNVLIQHLVLDGSLDAQMARTIVEKQNVADRALDIPFESKIPVIPTIEEKPEPGEPDDDYRKRVTKPAKYPAATENERIYAQESVQRLAGVCNYAATRDGAGFSKFDAHVGHSLAETPGPFTDGQVWLVKKLATKYQRQLPDETLAALGIVRKKK
jgi:SWI/SNF-related matrix-associated actin-dependent regulator 1 of chromatin subfamily A